MQNIGQYIVFVAVVLLLLVALGYSFSEIELPGGVRIKVNPPSWPSPVKDSNSKIPPTKAPLTIVSVENAIRDYYSLIQQKQYMDAWEMSKDYNISKGLSFDVYKREWEKSGPASIVELNNIEEVGNQATVTLTLYYPKKTVTHVLRYRLIRDINRGSQRFGYWMFVSGEILQ